MRERVTTSGGPGGQHANRTATRVELRVRLDLLPLDAAEVALLRERLRGRIRADGSVAVVSAASRSQLANRRSAREQLGRLLADALDVDAPRTPTRPTRASIERMRGEKRRHRLRKRLRRRPAEDDVD